MYTNAPRSGWMSLKSPQQVNLGNMQIKVQKSNNNQ